MWRASGAFFPDRGCAVTEARIFPVNPAFERKKLETGVRVTHSSTVVRLTLFCMNESANPIIKYFSEFKILKTVSKDFWLTNVVQFFDGMAYFSLITVFVLYLTDYCSFNDADAALWVGLYTLHVHFRPFLPCLHGHSH